MASNRSPWRQRSIAAGMSCAVILLALLAGEAYCRMFTRINFLDNSRGLFTFKRFGNSYGNTPNFEGVSFGETFVTNAEGMRVEPGFTETASPGSPGLLIMGDSVAFGPALKEGESIAGNLRRWMPSTRVMNAAAIGYDSFDYRTVTLAHVNGHPEVRTVALFICLNDISDASAQLIRSQNAMTSEPAGGPPSIVRDVNDYLRSRSKLYLWLKNALVDSQMYYFKYDLGGYQQGEENVSASLQPIIELDRELRLRGVALKVFVSPYEAQLRRPPPEGHALPQQLITSILSKNRVENYDLMPEFAAAGDRAKLLFLYGDPMHLSAEGARTAAAAACSKLEGCNIK